MLCKKAGTPQKIKTKKSTRKTGKPKNPIPPNVKSLDKSRKIAHMKGNPGKCQEKIHFYFSSFSSIKNNVKPFLFYSFIYPMFFWWKDSEVHVVVCTCFFFVGPGGHVLVYLALEAKTPPPPGEGSGPGLTSGGSGGLGRLLSVDRGCEVFFSAPNGGSSSISEDSVKFSFSFGK